MDNNWTQGLIHFYVQAMLLQLSLLSRRYK